MKVLLVFLVPTVTFVDTVSGSIYLDHSGTPLPSEVYLKQVFDELSNELLGNPRSSPSIIAVNVISAHLTPSVIALSVAGHNPS